MGERRERVLEAFRRLGSISAAARETGVPKTTVNNWVHAAGLGDSLAMGRPPAGVVDRRPQTTPRIEAAHAEHRPLPKRGAVKRYIITSAQNNTPVHQEFWRNLVAYADHLGAELMVSQFTYDVGSYAAGNVKPGHEKQREPLAYAHEVMPYKANVRVRLAPTLVFCGELDIRPTAVNPLSDLMTYTGTDSCIVPHAKIAQRPAPVAKGSEAKFLYTTGTCTLRNYIARKAGQKAEFHHAYAALIVEVDADGDWFVRQLNATDTGSFQDLTTRVYTDVDGTGSISVIDTDQRVDGIVWGDVHHKVLEGVIADACWGPARPKREGYRGPSIIDVLKPSYQFLHDLLDFRNRNHHDLNRHAMFRKWVNRSESVRDEIRACAEFLGYAARPDVRTVVVASNHDEALLKWLRTADYATDPVNAIYFLEAQLATYRAIEGGDDFNIVEWALRGECAPPDTEFLGRDSEYIVAGVDCGSHGDLGPNGFKGSPEALRRAARKRIVGHAHSAGIYDGLYVMGVTGAMDQGYNRGDSSWSRTHAIVYPNGKRTLFTMRGTKWRAC